MNLNTLISFRHEVYQSFKQTKDALFNLVDALVSEDRAQSLPELSLSPYFERTWASTYEALEDGIIDSQQVQKMFVAHLPPLTPMPLIAVDSTSIARSKARTSEDRSAQYVHNLPESAKPVPHQLVCLDWRLASGHDCCRTVLRASLQSRTWLSLRQAVVVVARCACSHSCTI
ncbi:MAG: hypothetical protein H0U76_09180 [Ktedonobacteraceae bacterium]|nr:hypothetical protein [Ktedonobacteraceae bacterium]